MARSEHGALRSVVKGRSNCRAFMSVPLLGLTSVGGQPDGIWLPLRMIFVQTISFEMSIFMVFTPPGMNGSTIKAGTLQMVTKISGIIAKATMATRCHEESEDKIAISGFTASNRPSRSINVYI